jgi:hypothetical protein
MENCFTFEGHKSSTNLEVVENYWQVFVGGASEITLTVCCTQVVSPEKYTS